MNMESKDILKKLRVDKNITQKEASEKIGVSYSAYQKYESGERELGANAVKKLADFYGVTTDYLLGREPLPNPFADLNLSEDDEKEVIEKYLSLPPEFRATMLDVLRQLGDVVSKNKNNDKWIPPIVLWIYCTYATYWLKNIFVASFAFSSRAFAIKSASSIENKP